MDSLVIKTGIKTIEIKNEKGDVIGDFDLNPSDAEIVSKYEKFVSDFENHEYKETDTTEKIKEAIAFVKAEFDMLLGVGQADRIFRTLSPLALISNSDFFFEGVLDGIVKEIERTTGARAKAKQKKVHDAVARYR